MHFVVNDGSSQSPKEVKFSPRLEFKDGKHSLMASYGLLAPVTRVDDYHGSLAKGLQCLGSARSRLGKVCKHLTHSIALPVDSRVKIFHVSCQFTLLVMLEIEASTLELIRVCSAIKCNCKSIELKSKQGSNFLAYVYSHFV